MRRRRNLLVRGAAAGRQEGGPVGAAPRQGGSPGKVFGEMPHQSAAVVVVVVVVVAVYSTRQKSNLLRQVCGIRTTTVAVDPRVLRAKDPCSIRRTARGVRVAVLVFRSTRFSLEVFCPSSFGNFVQPQCIFFEVSSVNVVVAAYKMLVQT
ncbi:hypothetical protein ACP70R_008583 [Stipagrostis hirtigluma subsp. patula]